MDVDRLYMRLGIIEMEDFKATIVMKSKRFDPFIAKVKGFEVIDQVYMVTFIRCEETVFPDDTDDQKSEEYTTAIKNIKSVDRYWDTPKE